MDINALIAQLASGGEIDKYGQGAASGGSLNEYLAAIGQPPAHMATSPSAAIAAGAEGRRNAMNRMDPASIPQPHPLDPNGPYRNRETGNQILDLIHQMTGGQRGHGSDGDMMAIGETMDAMDVISDIMGKPRPGEGRDQAAPGWDYDTMMSVLDATGRDPDLFDSLDDATMSAVLEELAGFDPNQVTAIIQEAEKSADGDGIYDLGPQQVPPMLLDILAGNAPTVDRERASAMEDDD